MSSKFGKILLIILIYPFGLISQKEGKTILIKGHIYVGKLTQSNFFILRDRKDTVLSVTQDYYVNFKFRDFNNDGFKDVLLEWSGNTPDRFNLYEFVPSTGKFKEVQNFSDFPLAKSIQGTKYYYSYYKSGCADKAWGSHLFYIHKYMAIKIGKIKGDACGVDDKIDIYKFSGQKELVYKTLPINTIDKYRDYKWGFIKQYWAKNFRSFL